MPTVTITDNSTGDFTGTKSAELGEGSPNSTNGGSGFEVSTYGSGDRRNGAIAFPGLSNITGPVTVSSATLRLYCSGISGTKTIDVNPFLRSWVEDDISWNSWSAGNSWTTGGATGAGDTTTAVASVIGPIATDAYFEISTAELAADVEAAINNGTGNLGWLVKINEYTAYDGSFYGFRGRTITDGQRPELVVVYSEGASFSAAWAAGSNQQVIQ